MADRSGRGALHLLSRFWSPPRSIVTAVREISGLSRAERRRRPADLLIKMLAHKDCTGLLKKLIPFLIDTGLRISEALALTWEHVGLKPKQGASLGWVYVAKGKSKYAKRHVPLTERSLQILSDMKKSSTSTFLFPAENGEQLSRHWPSEQFRTLRKAMKLPKDCVVHACRHTFCTRLGEAGADAFVSQRLAGHSRIVISQRYVHPTPERLEQAVSRLNPEPVAVQ